MGVMNAPALDLHDAPRSDWRREEIAALFALPFAELMFRAQSVHRTHFDPNEVQISTLLSIKTGGCPEDCGYCSQSSKYDTGVKASKLMEVEAVLADARAAKAAGASRFCMGAAWRNPKDKDLNAVCDMVEGVAALGMETCVTLGHADGAAGGAAESSRGWIITTTTWTPRRNTTAISSAHAHLSGPAGYPESMCAPPASMSVAAVLSAWARAPKTASGWCMPWPA